MSDAPEGGASWIDEWRKQLLTGICNEGVIGVIPLLVHTRSKSMAVISVMYSDSDHVQTLTTSPSDDIRIPSTTLIGQFTLIISERLLTRLQLSAFPFP